jgi:hypothetical protein
MKIARLLHALMNITQECVAVVVRSDPLLILAGRTGLLARDVCFSFTLTIRHHHDEGRLRVRTDCSFGTVRISASGRELPFGPAGRTPAPAYNETGANLGVRRQQRLTGMSRWLVGISVRIRNRAYHYRPRTEPEAVGRRRAVTSAFADFCSSGGSPGNWLSLR